jgi:hypothetical protein
VWEKVIGGITEKIETQDSLKINAGRPGLILVVTWVVVFYIFIKKDGGLLLRLVSLSRNGET